MNFRLISVMILVALFGACVSVLIGIFVYDKKNKSILQKGKTKDWLFADFQKTVYGLFYKKEPAEKLCGIDIDKFQRYCRILHQKPDVKNIISLRIEGFVIFMVCGILALLTTYSLYVMCFFIVIGFICFYGMAMLPMKNIEAKAEERLFQIKDDLPRFLALLEKAMDLPIDQAILITASKFRSPLAEDLMDCIHQVTLGADGWQSTLMDLAKTYDIESFNDLVLEIVNAYEQGVNIRPLINRKAYEIEQTHLYDVETHDAQIKSMIFLPIIGLKVLPLMALICLPMLSDFL